MTSIIAPLCYSSNFGLYIHLFALLNGAQAFKCSDAPHFVWRTHMCIFLSIFIKLFGVFTSALMLHNPNKVHKQHSRHTLSVAVSVFALIAFRHFNNLKLLYSCSQYCGFSPYVRDGIHPLLNGVPSLAGVGIEGGWELHVLYANCIFLHKTLCSMCV